MLAARHATQAPETELSFEPGTTALSIKVMTVNIHKGFTFFNRKFILHELRDAVRQVGADVVFLQEVSGTHTTQGKNSRNTRKLRITSFWPTASGPILLTDATPSTPKATMAMR